MDTFQQALEKARRRPKSPQSKWYWKMRSANRCVACGKELDSGYKIRCREHHEKALAQQRKRKGYKPWQEGKPGRPPREKEEENAVKN